MFSPTSFEENSYTEFVELGAVNFSYLQLTDFWDNNFDKKNSMR